MRFPIGLEQNIHCKGVKTLQMRFKNLERENPKKRISATLSSYITCMYV